MYNIHKIIKTTVLLAGLFGLVGCGGSCCESDTSLNKGNIPTPKSEIKNLTPDGNVTNNTPVAPIAVATINENDFNTVSPCKELHFDSNESKGLDENVTYSWAFYQGCELSDKSSFDYRFGEEGEYNVTLTISDSNQTFTDWVLLKVKRSCK